MGNRARRPPTRAATSGRVYRTACPVCKAAVESRDLAADKLFPFCSNRCKLVDLGKWFDGEYSLYRETSEEEAGEGEEGTE